MNIAVIFAGGRGNRFAFDGLPKQFVEVNGKPIVVHTIERFNECEFIDKIVVVCIDGWIEHMRYLIDKYMLNKVESVVAGGSTSQASIHNGLLEAKSICKEENAIVLIHDGVRPIVTQQLIKDNIDSVIKYGSAITVGEITETPLRVENNCVAEVFPREQGRIAKAPQSFWLNDILSAHEDAIDKGELNYLDSCSLMKAQDYELHYVDCFRWNIKVTTQGDLTIIKAFLDMKNKGEK